jgi:hypothetical protein
MQLVASVLLAGLAVAATALLVSGVVALISGNRGLAVGSVVVPLLFIGCFVALATAFTVVSRCSGGEGCAGAGLAQATLFFFVALAAAACIILGVTGAGRGCWRRRIRA